MIAAAIGFALGMGITILAARRAARRHQERTKEQIDTAWRERDLIATGLDNANGTLEAAQEELVELRAVRHRLTVGLRRAVVQLRVSKAEARAAVKAVGEDLAKCEKILDEEGHWDPTAARARAEREPEA